MNKTTVMVVVGLGLIAGYFFLARRASAAAANGNGATMLPNGETEEEGAGAIGVLEAQALSGIPPGGLPFNDLPRDPAGKGGSGIPLPSPSPAPAPAPSPSPPPPMFREPRRAGAGETYNIP